MGSQVFSDLIQSNFIQPYLTQSHLISSDLNKYHGISSDTILNDLILSDQIFFLSNHVLMQYFQFFPNLDSSKHVCIFSVHAYLVQYIFGGHPCTIFQSNLDSSTCHMMLSLLYFPNLHAHFHAEYMHACICMLMNIKNQIW